MFASNTSQVSSDAIYVEDVFSTYLYTGNGSTQTITNGIDLAGKGGLVWAKARTFGTDHQLSDSAIGPTKSLSSSLDLGAGSAGSTDITGFTSSGFSLNYIDGRANQPSEKFVSWTFREQPKFFDVVTWTGDGALTRQISHNLGSLPGCIIVKCTSTASTNWLVTNRGCTGADGMLNLNTTNGRGYWGFNGYLSIPGGDWAYGTAADTTSTFFTVAADGSRTGDVNQSGRTYVAYLFAHNAGGFGLTGTDNVISCGSFTTDTSGKATVNLGFEPQWVLTKRVDSAASWVINDNMRGMPASQTSQVLYPNLSNAESSSIYFSTQPTATGFKTQNYANTSYDGVAATVIYIAIRRGPMRTPTTGASVFEPAFATANSPEYKSNTVISGFDTALTIYRPGYSDASFSYPYTAARLTGARQILQTSRTNAEYTYSTAANFAYNTGWFNSTFGNDTNRESYMFKRAPGFHDVVCYTGTGSNTTVPHNLGVTPEFIITKARSTAGYDWRCYHSALGIGTTIRLNLANAASAGTQYVSVSSTNFVVGNSGDTDNSGTTYVSYLFASCPGVSKVGSYTGTGANQTINCGFASGVRFVLIKRTDSTGDWYVYDTTRGMTSGTDPYILLNSVAAEVTGTNYVETIATGFRLIGSNAGTNANGGTYIYLAIA